MEKLYRIAMATMIASILAIIIGVGAYIAWPHKLFETIPPIWVVQDEVHRGDALTTKLKVCKHTSRTAEIMLLWFGVADTGESYVRVLPTTSGSLPEGCKVSLFHVTDIPLNVPPGRYRVRSVMRYDLGLTRVEHSFVTEEFRVLP